MYLKIESFSGKEIKTGLCNNMRSGAVKNLRTGISFLKNIKTFQLKKPEKTGKIARFEISFWKEKFYFYLNDFDGRTNDDVIDKICKN